jgi:hypothetical protein
LQAVTESGFFNFNQRHRRNNSGSFSMKMILAEASMDCYSQTRLNRPFTCCLFTATSMWRQQ